MWFRYYDVEFVLILLPVPSLACSCGDVISPGTICSRGDLLAGLWPEVWFGFWSFVSVCSLVIVANLVRFLSSNRSQRGNLFFSQKMKNISIQVTILVNRTVCWDPAPPLRLAPFVHVVISRKPMGARKSSSRPPPPWLPCSGASPPTRRRRAAGYPPPPLPSRPICAVGDVSCSRLRWVSCWAPRPLPFRV